MDYYEVGQRIRKIRKARGLSQEELAEKIGISVTHMSHIETANTKMSLPVFVDIAHALGVQTDFLLTDYNGSVEGDLKVLIDELGECDIREQKMYIEILRMIKKIMAVYEK